MVVIFCNGAAPPLPRGAGTGSGEGGQGDRRAPAASPQLVRCATTMTYRLKLYEADAPAHELRAAERRFREALEASIGGPELVLPVYAAYQRIVASHGEEPAADDLSDAQRTVFEQWRAAATAAVAAAFGPNRYMGDAHYEIEP